MHLPMLDGDVRRRLTTLLIGAVALCALACDSRQATAPSSPPPVGPPAPAGPSEPTISGRVWLHTPDGVKPFANMSLFGWIDSGTSGRTLGRLPTDTDGRYRVSAAAGSRVRIQVNGDVYQPCVVTVNVVGDVTRDIHAVNDRLQLGAHLPSALRADAPVLGGEIFDIDEGSRRPLAGVRLQLDGLLGLGLATATTLTDADGRYVLCGLDGETSTVLYAWKSGYQLFETIAAVNGDTTLDIELQRS